MEGEADHKAELVDLAKDGISFIFFFLSVSLESRIESKWFDFQTPNRVLHRFSFNNLHPPRPLKFSTRTNLFFAFISKPDRSWNYLQAVKPLTTLFSQSVIEPNFSQTFDLSFNNVLTIM